MTLTSLQKHRVNQRANHELKARLTILANRAWAIYEREYKAHGATPFATMWLKRFDHYQRKLEDLNTL